MTFAQLYNYHAVYREAQGFHANMAESYQRMIDSGDMTEQHIRVMAQSVRAHMRTEASPDCPIKGTPFTDHFSDWLRRVRP